MKTIHTLFSLKTLSLILVMQLFISAEIATDSIQQDSLSVSDEHKVIETKRGLVYIFEIRKEIAKPVWRITQENT